MGKSNSSKKPRKYKMHIQVPSELAGGSIGFNKDTGCVLLLDAKGNVIGTEGLIFEHYYEGDQRRVWLSRLIAGPKSPLRGVSDLDFLATYDLIYIIDTNELKTGDNKVHHITSFLRCSIKDIGHAHQADVYERVGYFHFVNLNRKDPEKAGWINLFKHDFFQNGLKAGLKIGIIVDAYLQELDIFNSRSMPIADDHFLPEGVKLMHATADKKDTLVNHFLQASDLLANDYKKRFLAGEIQHPPQNSPIFKCESYWFLNEARISFNRNIIPKSNLVYGDDASVTLEILGVDANGNEMIETKKVGLTKR